MNSVLSITGLDEAKFRERELSLLREHWGRGTGPYYCDDPRLPWAYGVIWSFDESTGEYINPRPSRGTFDYRSGLIPWPHCSKCNRRLSKVGGGARCGRESLAGPQASSENPPPCAKCRESGIILCASCCQLEQAEAIVTRIKLLIGEQGNAVFRGRNVETCFDLTEYCYFIEGVGTGLIKIGKASVPQDRFRGLVTMSPVPLAMIAVFPGGRPLEALLHSELDEFRAHGEWFRDGPELRRVIVELEGVHFPSGSDLETSREIDRLRHELRCLPPSTAWRACKALGARELME